MPEANHQRSQTVLDHLGAAGPRLPDDGWRLWNRLGRFLDLGLAEVEVDRPALQLACFALQLPLRHPRPNSGRSGILTVRERAEQAAELLLAEFGPAYDTRLLEQTAAILRQMPQGAPPTQEARLLSDAVNLDEFGLTGFVVQALNLGRVQGSVAQAAEAFAKREEYGYWDLRLKSGFHFPAVREMARQRLASARAALAGLARELKEDKP
jgi:hypothetical protein